MNSEIREKGLRGDEWQHRGWKRLTKNGDPVYTGKENDDDFYSTYLTLSNKLTLSSLSLQLLDSSSTRNASPTTTSSTPPS